MKIFRAYLTFFLFAVIVSGCDFSGEDTSEAKRYEILQKLDEGNYQYVIDKLENDKSYQSAFSKEELKVNLAAAYIGKAGFDINSLINDMINSSDESNDGYRLFIKALSKRINGNSLNDLDKANIYYKEAIGNSIQNISDYCDTHKNELSTLQKDACFYIGLVDTAKATSSFGLLLSGGTDTNQDGDIAEIIVDWLDQSSNNSTECKNYDIDNNGIADPADATACEIEYSVNGSCSNPNITTTTQNITFTKNNKNYTYTLLTISLNPDLTICNGKSQKVYKKLISQEDGLPVIVDGYCKLDFSQCTDNNECYPCPVLNEEGEDKNIAEAVIETINNGADSIISVLPEEQQNDVKNAIKDFKKDLCNPDPSACLCTCGTITVSCNDISCNLNNADNIKIKSENVDLLSKYIKGDD